MRAIIQSNPVPWQSEEWSRLVRGALSDPAELLRRLDLDPSRFDFDPAAAFVMRVPEPFLARMRAGDAGDPLLRQVLPLEVEHTARPGFTTDPLGESAATVAPGVIRKYAGRALLIATPACAVHCRYCFRRHFPYGDHRQGVSFPSLRAIETDPSIREVILSGGDPLMLKDAALGRLLEGLSAIPHVERVRVHTRVPVVVPQRVTRELLDLLDRTATPITLVVHVNHPNELDAPLGTALAALHRTGTTLLNQSVLLSGVNDDARTLIRLSESLFAHYVLPYYLHLPDRVAGTQHFDVDTARARRLGGELAAALPGYLVPRLAREVPGATAKEILSFL